MSNIQRRIIKEKINYPIVQALFINFFVLIVLLLIFNPAQKSDDYYLSEIIYGAVSGKYDVHLVYNHVLLGYLLRKLLIVCPNVAWYTVLQVILVLFAFVTMTHYILKYYHKQHSLIICLTLLFVFGYECYIKITFTKTAAVLVAIGLFFLLKGILGEKNNVSYCIMGMMQIFCGMLFRIAVVNSVLAIMIGIFLVETVWVFVERKKINTRIICCVLAFLMIQIANSGLGTLNKYMYSLESEWSRYFYINDIKSKIIDYTQNEFEKYEEQYLEIGLSENDLKMIYNNEMYDLEVMTEEKLLSAISIVQQGSRNLSLGSIVNIKNIMDFMRSVPLTYVSIFSFSAFIILSFLALMRSTKKELLCWGWILLMVLGENYYLFLKGRVLQSHVDVGIIFSACVALLYYMEYKTNEKAEINKQVVLVMISLLVMCGITNKYKDFSSKSFVDYGSETACNSELNEEIAKVLSEDKEHLYLTNGLETVYSRWQVGAYEIIPKGYYSNVYSLSSYIWPSHRRPLETYGVDNPYREIVDSDKMYFLVSDYIEESSIERLMTYIREHYDERAELIKVKEVSTVNIYVCVTQEKELSDYPIGIDTPVLNVSSEKIDNNVKITGHYYLKNSNSYKQDVYLEVLNLNSKEKQIYYVLKKENIMFDDIMNGKYSSIDVTIPKSEYDSDSSMISLVLIADGKVYKEQIK